MSNAQSADSVLSKHGRVRFGAWPKSNWMSFNVFQVNIIVHNM